MSKNLFLGLMTALLLLEFTLAANAQHGRTEEKHVTFGKPIVVLRGKIKSVLITHSYVFNARKGQVLSVRLNSNNKDVVFAVFNAKDFEAIGDTVGEDRIWKDTISSTEKYSVIVSGLTAANYVLTIELK